MVRLKSPAEINDNQVNTAIYTELFNGVEQCCLVGLEREKVHLVYGKHGMDLCQIAPDHKRLNPSHPQRENVPSHHLLTEAEVGVLLVWFFSFFDRDLSISIST